MARTNNSKQMTRNNRKNKPEGSMDKRRRAGPRIPTAFKKEMESLNAREESESGSGSEGGEVKDLYEFEEEVAQEDLKKNRRFDDVKDFTFEMPEDFKDEEVESDEGEDEEIESDEGEDEEDNEIHLRMLEGITGMPKEAFNDEKKKKKGDDLSLHHADVSGQPVSVHDLLAQLQGKSGYSNLRKRVGQLEKKPLTVQPPLPKSEQDKIQRKVSDKLSRKEMTKWEPIIKRNRETPTLYFEQDLNLRNSTVGSIAYDFVPRSDFEMKIDELMKSENLVDAFKDDGAKLLELNKVSVDDVRKRQNELAKMRNLLFRHELKSKRIKKIKSKTYHKILKKDRMKADQSQLAMMEMMDPEAAKENARKLELKRAEERLTLKHKNSSKWAKRILKRGLDAQDDATRAAFSEQLQKHEELKRKMNSANDGSSSSESDSESSEDYESDGEMSKDKVSRVLDKARKKTKGVLEGNDDEVPKTGVFALPFMKRGMKKRQEEAYNEARQALEDYDETLKQLEDENEEGLNSDKNPNSGNISGKRAFGPVTSNNKRRKVVERVIRESDSEDEEERENEEPGPLIVERESEKSKGVDLGNALLDDDDQIMNSNSVYKSVNETGRETGTKATYEVAVFAGDSFKKVETKKEEESKKSRNYTSSTPHQDSKEISINQPYSSDSETEMVEGFINPNPTSSSVQNPEPYTLPSQSSLISLAFASDDVVSEFRQSKQDQISIENPEPEAPALIPGWGQWAHVQKKRGLPAWMVKEHEEKKREREMELKKRKDSKFKNVVISEGVDKKAEKLMAKSLPFPFTSREVYEQSIRMPIGPDFNPISATSALIRPEVVKKPGLIIKPIQYEEVDPHEKIDKPQRIIQGADPKVKSKGKGKSKKEKKTGGKSQKVSAKK